MTGTRLILCMASLVFLLGQADGSPIRPGDFERNLNFGGRNRSYLLHIPSGCDDKKPVPLVIVLHGDGANAAGMIRMTGMSVKADREGFIAVYPNGTGFYTKQYLTWNAGTCCGYAMENKVDDAGFIRALIGSLQKDFPIDPARIYATGISNGAMMAHRLACELSDTIAAIAPVAGALNCDAKPSKPVSVLIFHGTEDKSVLYEGGRPVKQIDPRQRINKPVSYAVSFWVKHDGCSAGPKKEEKGNLVIDTYSGGKWGTEVVLYTIKGGGHSWPGDPKPITRMAEPRLIEPRLAGPRVIQPRLVDPIRETISATAVIWDFFKRHPKKLPLSGAGCPKCGSEKDVIPIIYGLPDEKLLQRSNRGEVKLGGYVVTGRDPKWYCKNCRNKW